MDYCVLSRLVGATAITPFKNSGTYLAKKISRLHVEAGDE
jgi:hypothetical protein